VAERAVPTDHRIAKHAKEATDLLTQRHKELGRRAIEHFVLEFSIGGTVYS